MPIYEYGCQNCGHTLDARQKFSDPPLRTCPACSEDSLERLISESSFALKGSGWYADGYGPSGKKTGSATTPPAASGSTPAKTDSTPKAEPAKKADSAPKAASTKSD